jgi:hypothetical protein
MNFVKANASPVLAFLLPSIRLFALALASLAGMQGASAQCCSGGSGSPIAGGLSQGVLQERQMEISTTFQFIKSDQFYTDDVKDTLKFFDYYSSMYQYMRLGYGVSKNLTFSVEGGYYHQKKEQGLEGNPTSTYESSGIGDLILFPRYDVINFTTEKSRTEWTMGLGYKIPLGSYNDSAGYVEPFSGNTYYVTKPQSVQLSSGAQDIIFYTFLYQGFPLSNFRVFANGLYIKKGWNPIGEKIGDYMSASVFAGQTFFGKLGGALQVKWEHVNTMELNEDIRLYAYPNYDPDATGYTKVFLSPQATYTAGAFTFFAQADFPVYQKMVKTQVGSQQQYTGGISYRFFVVKSKVSEPAAGNYYCPMHPSITSPVPDKCPQCGMDLVERK